MDAAVGPRARCGKDGELKVVTAMEPMRVAGSDSFRAGYAAGEPIMRTMPEALDLRDATTRLTLPGTASPMVALSIAPASNRAVERT